MMTLPIILLIGLGGFIGTILRYTSGVFFVKAFPAGFPYATLSINLIGCLLIGIIYGYFDRAQMETENWKSFLTIGICGGFTTFSAFSFENMQLLRDGQYGSALLYIFISIIVGLALTFAGFMLAKH